MKRTSIILLTATILFSCNKTRTGLSSLNLNGDVWKIEETKYYASENYAVDSVATKHYTGHSSMEFNKNGFLVETRYLGRIYEGVLVNYSYNRNNIKTGVVTLKDGKVEQTGINFIENQKIVKAEYYNNKGALTHTIYLDSEEGLSNEKTKKHKEYMENQDGKFIGYSETETKDGFLIKQQAKDSLGNVLDTYEYVRNVHNDVISRTYTSSRSNTKTTDHYSYEYDDQHNWIKCYEMDKKCKINYIVIREIKYYNDAEADKDQTAFIGNW